MTAGEKTEVMGSLVGGLRNQSSEIDASDSATSLAVAQSLKYVSESLVSNSSIISNDDKMAMTEILTNLVGLNKSSTFLPSSSSNNEDTDGEGNHYGNNDNFDLGLGGQRVEREVTLLDSDAASELMAVCADLLHKVDTTEEDAPESTANRDSQQEL